MLRTDSQGLEDRRNEEYGDRREIPASEKTFLEKMRAYPYIGGILPEVSIEGFQRNTKFLSNFIKFLRKHKNPYAAINLKIPGFSARFWQAKEVIDRSLYILLSAPIRVIARLILLSLNLISFIPETIANVFIDLTTRLKSKDHPALRFLTSPIWLITGLIGYGLRVGWRILEEVSSVVVVRANELLTSLVENVVIPVLSYTLMLPISLFALLAHVFLSLSQKRVVSIQSQKEGLSASIEIEMCHIPSLLKERAPMQPILAPVEQTNLSTPSNSSEKSVVVPATTMVQPFALMKPAPQQTPTDDTVIAPAYTMGMGNRE